MKKDKKNNLTKERILSKAEILFARKGYHGVSVREITATAKCNMAAVNYHFGSKEKLYAEMFRRQFALMISGHLETFERVLTNPDATLEDVFQLFFRDYSDPVPVRTISGRHVEAAGTKTVQILFEGYYNGYFEPDVHYIPLKKDFSDTNEVFYKFQDEGFCRHLAENAYAVVTQELTYEKLIDRFYEALLPIV